MERVSIRFDNGVLTVKDERGKPVATSRATVYLVTGNEYPVALLNVEGTQAEFAVSSLDVASALPVVAADAEVLEEGLPKKKGGKE